MRILRGWCPEGRIVYREADSAADILRRRSQRQAGWPRRSQRSRRRRRRADAAANQAALHHDHLGHNGQEAHRRADNRDEEHPGRRPGRLARHRATPPDVAGLSIWCPCRRHGRRAKRLTAPPAILCRETAGHSTAAAEDSRRLACGCTHQEVPALAAEAGVRAADSTACATCDRHRLSTRSYRSRSCVRFQTSGVPSPLAIS